MDVPALLARMERLPAALDALLAGLPDADWRRRPPEGGWSIAEVVGHLLDEETDDFRTRVRSTLDDPAREWPPIDPDRTVAERRHQERDPAELLRRFREERAASLAWLRSLPAADWSRAKTHPKMGPLHAGDLMAAWAAHDARHLTQIGRRLHALAAADGAPYSVDYAG